MSHTKWFATAWILSSEPPSPSLEICVSIISRLEWYSSFFDLGAHNAYKFNPTDNRGYYACALTHGRWNTGHLVTGGNDQLVKGINEDGKERYFALSFVDNVTDYYKRLDQ